MLPHPEMEVPPARRRIGEELPAVPSPVLLGEAPGEADTPRSKNPFSRMPRKGER